MLAEITFHLPRMRCILVLAVHFMCFSLAAEGQQASSSPAPDSLITRIAGRESTSGIEYVRLILNGKSLKSDSGGASRAAILGSPTEGSNIVPPAQLTPQLTAQCTKAASGKLGFEMFVNFGGVSDTSFYPPWKPASSTELFPPLLVKSTVTMEFLGYTHVKPVKRQFEAVLQPAGQYRYNTPSGGSSNMEDITYYLRFLLALPTLRVTLPPHSAEFFTTQLLNQIRSEPLCKASLL
jgi:hypothetical protein